jgi:hypothetical protein
MIGLSLISHFADAATKAACSTHAFFVFDPWWKYLDVKKDSTGLCQVVFDFPYDLTLVALAILDMLLRLAGLIAVAYVIYGGIQYVTSQGEPEGIKNAQNTIINALIGLAITLMAAATISFIGARLG